MTFNGDDLKKACIKMYNETLEANLDSDKVMIRNPNQCDIGQQVKADDKVENMFFYDGKQIYLQRICDRCISYTGDLPIAQNQFISILVREWDPSTWQLSELKFI